MASASGSDVIRVLTWNINGLKDKLKKKERKTELLEIFDRYDIVLLQENHIGKDYNKNWKIITDALSQKYDLIKLEDQTCRETADNQEEEEEDEEEDDDEDEEEEEEKEKEEKKKTMYVKNFSSRIKRVAILVNKPHTLLSSSSEDRYYAWVHVQIDEQKYTFVSVCDQDDGFQIVCLMLQISPGDQQLDAFKCRVVIGGDFNTTLNPELDAITENPEHAARRKMMDLFLLLGDMSDVWREKHPEKRKYTHTLTQSRLDYIFMLEDDVKYVESCEIHNDIDLSDHSPVSLTLNYTDRQPPIEEKSVEESD